MSDWNGTHFAHDTWANADSAPERLGRSTARAIVAITRTMRIGETVEAVEPAIPGESVQQHRVIVVEVVAV